MNVLLGFNLLVISVLYGYSLAVQPRYATRGARRVAQWTHDQAFFNRCAIAFIFWLVFMTGLYLVAHGTN